MGFLSSLLGRRNKKHEHCSGCKGSCRPAARHLRPLRLVGEPLEKRELLSVSPLSGEWLVNSVTANTQKMAEFGNAVAAMPDGGYVVSWTSSGQDGDGKGVYAQQFDATGTVLGNEFRLNTTTANNQQYSSVAAAADGSWVAVWQSSGQDGDGKGIYGQRFNSNGQATGSEFRVNVTTNNDQETPTVACLTDGGFVVVWAGKGSGDNSGVFGRRYNSAGVAQGTEFLVNTEANDGQKAPTVAALPDGGFIAAWESHGDQDGDGEGVYAQRYDSSASRVGDEFRVNTTTDGAQESPAIGVGPDGQYTIAWQTKNLDGSGYAIGAQSYHASGVAVGDELLINSTTNDDQQYPSVAYNDHGGYAIAWSGKGTGDSSGVFVREFDSNGTALGTESRVNATTESGQKYPSIVAAGSGYVVAWSGNGTGDSDGAFLRRLGSSPTTSGIADVTVEEDSSDTAIDLFTAFDDAESSDGHLVYEVIGNTNPELFSAVGINNGRLELSYAPDAFGAANLTVRATDPGGLAVETTFAVNVTSVNDKPVISELSVMPDAVLQGSGITLEAMEVTDDHTVAAVNFYRDANGNGVLDPTVDQFLGQDTDGSDGWAIEISTAGWEPRTYWYFSQATDNEGMLSNVAIATGRVDLMAIMDDSQAGYTESGTGWTASSGSQDYLGGSRRHAAGTGENKASWNFPDLPACWYEVYLTWTAQGDQATDASYVVYDGDTVVDTIEVNQQTAPQGEMAEGWVWQLVGSYRITTGQMRVVLSDDADGYVVADAVRIVDPLTLYWDANGSSAGVGGTGTWDTTSQRWRSGSTSGPLTTWVAGSIAVFGSTAGTVTIPDGVAISADSIQLAKSGYTISRNVSGSLTLTSTGTAISTTYSATINVPILVGANQIWTAGSGDDLILSGNVDLGSYSLTVQGSGDTSVSGVISCPVFDNLVLLEG